MKSPDHSNCFSHGHNCILEFWRRAYTGKITAWLSYQTLHYQTLCVLFSFIVQLKQIRFLSPTNPKHNFWLASPKDHSLRTSFTRRAPGETQHIPWLFTDSVFPISCEFSTGAQVTYNLWCPLLQKLNICIYILLVRIQRKNREKNMIQWYVRLNFSYLATQNRARYYKKFHY